MSTWCCIAIMMSTFSRGVLSPAPQKTEIKETYDRAYWYTQAQETLQKRLQYASEKNPVAKNVILVVGDGMSLTTATAARILRGQRRGQSGEDTDLAWDIFPAVALAKTYNIDAQTGESSACATALLCGVKARYETLGLDAGGRFNNCASTINSKVSSLVDWAHEAGKSTGIVTTARVTHATPAALYAHAPSRYWEDDSRVPPTVRKDCKDIAMQLIENEPGRSINVVMGGGRRHFLPTVTTDPEHPNREGRRLDGRNLAEDWAREKKRRWLRAQYIYSKDQLAKLDSRTVDYVLGLFEYSHMEFNAERGMAGTEEGTEAGSATKADDPSLADMTRAALSILSKNDKGFFLLIEGGRIDHAHHYNNPYRALDETLELETALLAALERVNPAETLIVVTADHGHVMTFGGQATPRGHPVLGADTVPSDIDGLRYTTLLYGTGPGHSEPRALPLNTSSSSTTPADAVHAAAVPRQWATHGGEDVPIYALGPMATILFAGVVEQSYIPHAIAYAACIAHQSRRCQEKVNITQPVSEKVPNCVPPEVSSVSAADETRSDGSGGRRVVVASSVMSDERVTRSSASLPASLITSRYLISIMTVVNLVRRLNEPAFYILS
ncbi:hypothetical protein K1T71_001207 [Dendrolimus kikuchii]|uniref:Uncharacterized protein n=1 Tax=Dendrolimus kikuchii TaxID=765133 RepID=A0ACC1DHA3_9NEOP|nr:hypothetical protein K1T71_001207 [Dendrolimus kikuchii]